MRYSIDHVWEGIQLHRQEHLVTLKRGEQRLLETQQALQARVQAAPAEIAELLYQAARKVEAKSALHQQHYPDRDGNVLEKVAKALRRLPSEYDLDKVSRELQQNRDRQTAVQAEAASRDTRLEQFLRALQQGGETHVSQHSLKQAGFDGAQFTNYVLARANAQPQDGG